MNKVLTLSALVLTLMLSSCGQKSSDSASKGSDSTTVAANLAYNGKIAYLRMDSLMRGYGMYIDMSDTFTKKQAQVQSELQAKGRALEREMMEYQDKAQKGLVTRYQAQTIEEGLQKKQQDLVAYRDRVMNEMGEQEAVMSNNISKAVMDYLKEYNNTKLYSMIFQTTGGTPILIADPSLDITAEVLAELNKRYLADKEKEAAKAPQK